MNQKTALDILKAGRNVYLTGPAGSGKTYVIRQYVEYLKQRGVGVAITASTGIAATHIGGVTIHSWSGIGLRDFLSSYHIDELTEKEYLFKRYEKTKVLVIDEISMLHPNMLDGIDRIARAMKGSDQPFGGIQIVLSGDFFQLPPIVRGEEELAFVTKSKAWKESDIRICYLEEQWRQNDSSLERILNEMRSGEVSVETKELLSQYSEDKNIGDFVPTRLFTHNRNVDELNAVELSKLPGDTYQYEMHSKGKKHIVENIIKGILAPEVLSLKKNAVVMFVKNNFEEGYVNGTLGVVEEFDENDMPEVRTFKGDLIKVSGAKWIIEENGKVLGEVTQLPLRLAWAITIHKSQGMTLDCAEIDLSEAFVPGQGYVALSRLRSLEGLVLRGANDIAFMVHPNVLKMDISLKKESNKWEKVIARFSDAEITEMHNDFIIKCGGTVDEKEIEKNKNKENEAMPEKVSTYEKTKLLILEKKSLQEMADQRGMTIGTIISHIEKLSEKGEDLDISYLRPKEADLKKIKSAFAKSKDDKLTPVWKKLKGKYSFEELRIAKLFIKK